MTERHATHSAKLGSVPATRLLHVPWPSIPDDILSLSGPPGAPGVVNNSLYKKFYISGDKDRKKNPYLWSGLNRVSVGGNKVFKDESISFNSSANCVKP